MHIFTCNVQTHIRTYMRPCIHASAHACMCHMHAYMHTDTYIYICLCVCMVCSKRLHVCSHELDTFYGILLHGQFMEACDFCVILITSKFNCHWWYIIKSIFIYNAIRDKQFCTCIYIHNTAIQKNRGKCYKHRLHRETVQSLELIEFIQLIFNSTISIFRVPLQSRVYNIYIYIYMEYIDIMNSYSNISTSYSFIHATPTVTYSTLWSDKKLQYKHSTLNMYIYHTNTHSLSMIHTHSF